MPGPLEDTCLTSDIDVVHGAWPDGVTDPDLFVCLLFGLLAGQLHRRQMTHQPLHSRFCKLTKQFCNTLHG